MRAKIPEAVPVRRKRHIRKLLIGDVHVCMKRPCIHLTPREADTMQLLLEGRSNTEIAYRQGLKPCTVKGRLENMFKKFSVNSRTELVVYGFRVGLFK